MVTRSSSRSVRPAAGAPAPLALVPGGMYGLAISAYDVDPVDLGDTAMWSDSPFGDQTSPDLSPGPLGTWTGTSFGSGDYHIVLAGATFCDVPEPASLSLLVLGGLMLVRRR